MGLAGDVAESIARLLDPFPPLLIVFLIAALPVVELRGSIPFGIAVLDQAWLPVLLVSVVGNIVVVPPIFWLLRPVEELLRRVRFMDRFLTWLFDRTRRRTRQRIETYEELALFLFVALPLPGTGAWTGSLVAHLFDLPRHKSFWIILTGVVTAGIVVTLAVLSGVRIFSAL